VDASLYSKAGAAATAIARDLLARSPGDRLPTVAEYADRSGVGINTVQRALALLQQSGDLAIRPRGRLGTYLVSLDRIALWGIAVGEPLVGFMPLPYSRRYEGLATALRSCLAETGVPFSLAFMSGAELRLDAVRSGHAFAVVSALAADVAVAEGRPVRSILEIPGPSYVAAHGVISRQGDSVAPRRIGADPNSIDQVRLSRAEFGEQVELVPATYLQLVDSIRRGQIDAAVWALDSVSPDHEISAEPLRNPAAIALESRAVTAALVVATDDRVVEKMLLDQLDPAVVAQVQRDVLSGARQPSY
jgi:hypothetical protein